MAGLILGKHHSSGLPGKNYMDILGRPMVEYALMANENSKHIDEVFVSTDSPTIKQITEEYDASVINRPEELATSDALAEDAIIHALNTIENKSNSKVNILSVSFANAPQIPVDLLDHGVEKLSKNEELDSAFSVSRFNMFSPYRARKISEEGLIKPFEADIIDESKHSSNRDSLGDCYFIDWAIQLMRRRTVLSMKNESDLSLSQNNPPWRQFGEKTYALKNDYAFDVDVEWQVPVVEKWLREHGFSETTTPYNN